MNWILDNIQVLIGVAAAVAYWLNKRREERLVNEQETDPGLEPEGEPASKSRLPPVLEEARRRLLEELRLPVEPETVEEPPVLREFVEERPVPAPWGNFPSPPAIPTSGFTPSGRRIWRKSSSPPLATRMRTLRWC